MMPEDHVSGHDPLADRIAGLPPEKRALLEKMLLARRQQVDAVRTIPRRAAGQTAPLSFSQQRLWFFEQMEPGTAVFNGPIHYRIRGPLDRALMERALDALAQRHESLRTSITSTEAGPVQHVHERSVQPMAFEDLSTGPHAETEALKRSVEERTCPFRLEDGPCIRSRLLRLGANDHVLLITIHHIAFDGWSVGLLLRDLLEIYAALRAGRDPVLPALPIQFADFAAWQRSPAAQEGFRQQRDYWKARLSGASMLELPLDVQRPAVQSFRGDTRNVCISEATTAVLRSLAQSEGVTLFMLLLAAWSVQLGRLCGQTDVVIGSPVAGRTRQEVENLIGFFVNTLALRNDLSGNPSFRELLRRVRKTTTEAFANQDLPFDQVVTEVAPGRELGRSPLFQVLLNFLNFSGDIGEGHSLAGLRIEAFPAQSAQSSHGVESKFDLTLYGIELKASIQLVLAFNTDLFSAVRIDALLAQLSGLLDQIASHPDAPIGSITLVTREFSRGLPDVTRAVVPGDEVPAHALFESAARRYPERTALVDSWGSWSYAEVDRASARVSRLIRAQGVNQGDCVAICLDRSAALAVAVLGVMRSGASFLILDPAYPVPRLAEYWSLVRPRALVLLDGEADPAFLLVQNTHVGTPRIRVPRASTSPSAAADTADSEPLPAVHPEATAYHAFTSGSEGRPKAVVATHRPLAHFLRWHVATHAFLESDRFSMLSGLAHDPLLRDILTPLAIGAALIVPPVGPAALGGWGAWMRDEAITVAHLTPPLGRLIVQELVGSATEGSAPAPLKALRYAFFGGDSLLREDVRRLRTLAPDVQCVSFYGATETPQAMGFHSVQDGGATGHERFPIGRGIDGVDLLVMASTGHLAGVGELGEIHVRTPYLAAGYLDDPQATAQKFLADPWVPASATRIYRTGDLGRYLPDGQVEFFGRADQQVKVRGFRVELDEVSLALSSCRGVRQGVVTLRPDPSGAGRLVGYFVASTDPAPLPEELRATLASCLPDYMVPSVLVPLESLPLTPNGKVDRRALPEPGMTASSSLVPLVEPSSSLESKLALIWRSVLGIERVGVDDNFFDRGGHSLLVVQLHRRIGTELGIHPPLLDLFKYPTIRRFARHVDRVEPQEQPSSGVKLAERATNRNRAFDRQKELARRNRPA